MNNSFEVLFNRYVLRCRLRGESGLHVGSGVPNTESDSPFIQRDGKAFLPGSSLRGAFRSHAERLLRTLGQGPRCCVLFQDDNPDCVAGTEKSRKVYERADARQLERLRQREEYRFCPVCRLFGSTIMAARLKIWDAEQTGTAKPAIRRDGVGIDRDTETAKEHIKYDFEVLEAGAEFEFTMQLENAEADEFAVLHVLISELKRGIGMGGKRNRGLGQIRLLSFSVEYFDRDRGHPLVEYLKTGKLAELTAAQFEELLAKGFQEVFLKERSDVQATGK